MTDGATTEVGTGRDGSAPFGPANGSVRTLRVRRRKRLMTKEDWALLTDVIELVIWRAEQRYKAKRNEDSKHRTTRTR